MEIQDLVRKKFKLIKRMDRTKLLKFFKEESGSILSIPMIDEELMIACGRLYQNRLWIERTGIVPGDISQRDWGFWNSLSLEKEKIARNF